MNIKSVLIFIYKCILNIKIYFHSVYIAGRNACPCGLLIRVGGWTLIKVDGTNRSYFFFPMSTGYEGKGFICSSLSNCLSIAG